MIELLKKLGREKTCKKKARLNALLNCTLFTVCTETQTKDEPNGIKAWEKELIYSHMALFQEETSTRTDTRTKDNK